MVWLCLDRGYRRLGGLVGRMGCISADAKRDCVGGDERWGTGVKCNSSSGLWCAEGHKGLRQGKEG